VVGDNNQTSSCQVVVRDATDDSPVVDTIPPNSKGVIYLGETQGQWIFVEYDRSNGWVNLRFVSPVASQGGRIW
jgi:hypothetical protein